MPTTPVPTIAEVRSEVAALEAECHAAGLINILEKLILTQESHHDGTVFHLDVVDAGNNRRPLSGHDGDLGVGRRTAFTNLQNMRLWAQEEGNMNASVDAAIADHIDECMPTALFPTGNIGDDPVLQLTPNDLVRIETEITDLREELATYKGSIDKILDVLADRTREWDNITLAGVAQVLLETDLAHVHNQWFMKGPK